MASIYDIKPSFQKLLRPLSNGLANKGVTPNQITMAAILLSLITGALIAYYPDQRWPLLFVPLSLLLRMMLNAIDGMIAREHNLKSALGTFLNELGDVISDIFIYLPFSVIPGITGSFVVGVIILAIISEMAGVVGVQISSSRRYDGPMGKSDRAFVFGAIALYLGLGYTGGAKINYLLLAIAFLSLITIFNRIIQALREQHA